MPLYLPEDTKCVCINIITAANAATYDYICCKNAHKVWFYILHTGANDTDYVVSLIEATDVAAGTTSAVTATHPLWVDSDAGTTSDTLVRQTDAANYTVDPATEANALIIFEWDPAKHTAGYDCISLTDTGGHGSNTVAALAFIQERYHADQPPSAIID